MSTQTASQTMTAVIPILMYHSVAPDTTPTFAPFTVTPAEFGEHVRALIEADWLPVTFAVAAEMIRSGKPMHRRHVVITADDGLRDFAEYAVPSLRDAGATASLFIPTAYVGSRAAYMDGEDGQRAMLDWTDLVALAREGFEIGSHGHRHLAMDRTQSALLRSELTRSRSLLQDNVGVEATTLAYPYGYQTGRVRAIVKEVGFSAACTVTDVDATSANSVVALPRLHVLPATTGEQLIVRLNQPTARVQRTMVRTQFAVFYCGRPWTSWGVTPTDAPMSGYPRWIRS